MSRKKATSIKGMTCDELNSELRNHGLPTSGNKADKQRTLQSHYNDHVSSYTCDDMRSKLKYQGYYVPSNSNRAELESHLRSHYREKIQGLTTDSLRYELNGVGLPVYGTKEELQQRYMDYCRNN